MRVYNGKALINSVNGKQEVHAHAVFPLVQNITAARWLRWRWTREAFRRRRSGRMAGARRRSVRTAAEVRHPDKRHRDRCAVYDDQLRQPAGALVTLETVRRVRQELGCNTILGVSNISFGLPQREIVNCRISLRWRCRTGLSAAIINPNSGGHDALLTTVTGLWQHWMNTAAIRSAARQRGWRFQQAGVGGASGAGAAGSAGSGAPAAGAAGASGSADTGSQASGPERQTYGQCCERGFKRAGGMRQPGNCLKTVQDALDRHQQPASSRHWM